MEMENTLKVTGDLTLELRDEFGNLKELRHEKNTVVTVGKNWIAARMKDAGTPVQMTHMGIGDSDTGLGVGNTTLGNQLTLGRQSLTTAGGLVTNNVVTYACTFAAGQGTGNVKEAGIFNGSGADTMLCRTTFGVITKAAADTLTINWNVTIS